MNVASAEARFDEAEAPAGAEPMPAAKLLEQAQLHLEEQAKERPYMVLLAAVGVGYVLGGGVPLWALRAASKAGTRVVAASLAAAVFGEAASRRMS